MPFAAITRFLDIDSRNFSRLYLISFRLARVREGTPGRESIRKRRAVIGRGVA